jgi:hypothetical protein
MNTVRHVFTHWITSLGGLLIAAGNIHSNGMTLKSFLLSAAIAALGAFAADPGKIAPKL